MGEVMKSEDGGGWGASKKLEWWWSLEINVGKNSAADSKLGKEV